MKKFLISLVCVVVVVASFIFAGCDMSDEIENGTYICENPYIKFIYEVDNVHGTNLEVVSEIYVDGVVKEAIARKEHGNIFFYEFQEEDTKPTDGIRMYDNEIYAKFYYKFDDEKHQLILKEWETNNIYHLDKVE